ncbi:MAG: hypothetical protein U5K38_05625 [Woeseiaceae bacterium]|nr:hypothetical protein [Woeseiaceae bacterium]
MSTRFPSLPNLECLIDGEGEITIGRVGPVHCAATASYEHDALAMLVRRDDETLEQLLIRLDRAIEMAQEEDAFIDEINNGMDNRI